MKYVHNFEPVNVFNVISRTKNIILFVIDELFILISPSFIFFFNFIVYRNYKTTIVSGEMIERKKEKCHVYDERKSPTGTTRSV